MNDASRNKFDEVEQLLLNAQLRDALEPYIDDSFQLLNLRTMPTPKENDYLASILAWERAPVLPISQWFDPELMLPLPDSLDDDELHSLLWDTIHKLYEKRVVLQFTDHLSDRQLYCVLVRDILRSPEKKLDLPKNYLHWHCLDDDDDADIWLRYYATPEEREGWQEENSTPLPSSEPPPFPRTMPRRPLR